MTQTAEQTHTWRLINPERLIPVQLPPDQLDEALDILDEACTWLAARGANQWPASFRNPLPTDTSRDRITELQRYASHGQLWVLRDLDFDRQAVATLVVTHWPDLDFAHHWPGGHSELFNARYLRRGAVRRAVAGQHVGGMLLGFAAWIATNVGVAKLRMECSKHNTKLHDLVRTAGFTHVGTVDLEWRKTGALFERALPPTNPSADDVPTPTTHRSRPDPDTQGAESSAEPHRSPAPTSLPAPEPPPSSAPHGAAPATT